MYMGAVDGKGTLAPPPLPSPPFKCDKKGSWPARHFLPLTPPSSHWIWDRSWQPRQKSRMASILEVVNMIADLGQQQWSYTNFQLSDRTLRSRDRILEFSQELVKICAAANNLDLRVYFGMSGRYNQPVQYGRDSVHKSRAGWAVFSLGVYITERQHIYEIWTRALQPVQEEVSSWRFCRVQTLSGPPTFSRSADISPGAEILTSAKITSSAYISVRRQHFTNPPTFCASANIFMRRQYFGIRQYFHETPIFWKSA